MHFVPVPPVLSEWEVLSSYEVPSELVFQVSSSSVSLLFLFFVLLYVFMSWFFMGFGVWVLVFWVLGFGYVLRDLILQAGTHVQ